MGLPAPVVATRKRRERMVWAGIAAATLVVGALGAWMLKPAPVVSSISERFSFALPEGQTFTRTGRRYLAISPDGRRMTYVADKRLYLREMHQLAAVPIAGTEEDPLEPAFSPDGQWIAYFVPLSGQSLSTSQTFMLKKIRINGGSPVPLCPTDWPYGLSWRGNTLLFGQNTDALRGIQSVPDTAGTPTTLVTVGAGEFATHPQFLGDGGAVLFTLRPAAFGNWEAANVVVQAPGETTPTVVVKNATDGRLIAGDRLVYYQGGSLLAIGFDARARATRGGPVPMVEGIQMTNIGSGAAVFSVADNGTMVFVPGSTVQEDDARRLVWVDRQRKEMLIAAPPRSYRHPRLSPDGRWIVVAVNHDRPKSNLYTWDLEREVFSPLTPTGDQADAAPLWMPDSRSVIYSSVVADGTTKIMRVDANGANAPEMLLDLGRIPTPSGYLESVSPDGKLLTYRVTAQGRQPDMMVLPLDGPDRTPRPLLNSLIGETHGAISPDGRWLAYASFESQGTHQIFVRPFPKVETARWPISTMPGSSDPVWARSSNELFFLTPTHKLVGVSLKPGPVFSRETEILDATPYLILTLNGTDYDVSPDGRRFLMIKRLTEAAATTKPAITVVTHWVDELKARVKWESPRTLGPWTFNAEPTCPDRIRARKTESARTTR